MSDLPPPMRATAFLKQGDTIWAADVDLIEYGGDVWLVLEWRGAPDGRTQTPARAVSLAGVPVQLPHHPGLDAVLTIQHPLPKELFDTPIPPAIAARFVVTALPEARFAIPA